jgi:hypothetical protein
METRTAQPMIPKIKLRIVFRMAASLTVAVIALGLSRRALLGAEASTASSPALSSAAAQAQESENEIVANLAGGRVIVHVTKDDVILFAMIDHPVEAGSVPPRLLNLDRTHIGILFGASEWREPADPKPIRLDRDYQAIGGRDPHAAPDPSQAEPDLETIGVGFLERLRPLTSQLHHRVEMKKDDPLFEIVVIGYAPNHYGPEVWTVEYRIEQVEIGTRADYLQTRILRPRFEQLYPPEKKAPRFVIETRYPADIQGPTVMDLIQGGDPRIAKLRDSDPKIAKAVESISRGQSQKADTLPSTDFMRALLPLIVGNASFAMGKMEEQAGFNWIVPPDEPVEKRSKEEKAKEDQDRPPEAPSLRKRPQPQK